MRQDSWLRVQTAVMAALALICGAGVILSQRPDSLPRMDPSKMAQQQLGEMKVRLKLTAAQESEIKPFLDAQSKQMAEVWDKTAPGSPLPEAVLRTMRESRAVTAKRISEALTDEQNAEYQKMMSERRGSLPGGSRGGPARQL